MSIRQPQSNFQSQCGATIGTEEDSITTDSTDSDELELPTYPQIHPQSPPQSSIRDYLTPPQSIVSWPSSSRSRTMTTGAEALAELLYGSTTTATQQPLPPRLPSGQEINAKNTCQSHTVIVVTEFNTTTPASELENGTTEPQGRPHPAMSSFQTSTTDYIAPSPSNKNHQTNKDFGRNTRSDSTVTSHRSRSPNGHGMRHQYRQSRNLLTQLGYKSSMRTHTRNSVVPPVELAVPDTDTASTEMVSLNGASIVHPPPLATARIIMPETTASSLIILLQQPMVHIEYDAETHPIIQTSTHAANITGTSFETEKSPTRKTMCAWTLLFTLLISLSAVIVPTVYCVISQSCLRQSRPSRIADDTVTAPAIDHDRRAAVIDFINNITFTGRIIAQRNTSASETSGAKPLLSAEEWAVHWLIEVDPLKLFPNTTLFRRRIVQRYALLTLWFQREVQFEWNKTDKWASLENECRWYGIHCEEMIVDGINSNVVTKVHLPYNNIVGTMSPELGLLSTLTYWNMSGNGLQEEIPKSVWESWKHIEYFEMYSGRDESFSFQGDGVSIGDGFHAAAVHWKNIRYFAMQSNYIYALPSSLYQWSNIEHFDISSRQTSQPFPDFMRAWSRLTSLTLDTVFIAGSLPSWIGEWTNLEEFAVTDCIGTIPSSVGNWTNIRSFRISGNGLSGTLPITIGMWTKLQVLNLRQSYSEEMGGLTGTLPSEIANWSELRSFNIANNKFSGSVPRALYQWKRVTNVDFSNNRFTGSLPLSMTAIESADFSSNRFNGSIHTAIGQWTNIRSMNFQNNILHGTIPLSIGRCSSLEYFDGSDNSLTGTIPGSIGNWRNIREVTMASNKLNGRLPDSMMHWSMINSFDFGNNTLTGTLPSYIGRWAHLTSLRVNNNQFHGKIPVAKWRHLWSGDFHGNNFTGSIPIELCFVTKLYSVNDDETNVTDLVADCLGKVECVCCTRCF